MRATGILARPARLAAVALAVLSVSACDVVVTSLESKGKAQDQWSRTYPLTSGDLEIANMNGSIEVVGADGGQVEVVAERTARAASDEDARRALAELQIAEEVSATRIRLETKPARSAGRRFEVSYHVKVPAGVNLRLGNQNGTISVSTMKGGVIAETSNGAVKGRDLAGPVEASTTNGPVRLEVVALAPGGIRAETVNGPVELTMPAAAKADVQASCVNGGIALQGVKLDGSEVSRRHVAGRMNGGGAKVVLETTNGPIRLIGK
jgi:hypothetical protein